MQRSVYGWWNSNDQQNDNEDYWQTFEIKFD
jgi:hypothetical protein